MSEPVLKFPVPAGSPVSQGFGENPADYAKFGQAGHNGLDFQVPIGTPVRAAADGQVTLAQMDATGYGLVVKILHGGLYETLYGHNSRLLVTVGKQVRAGDIIAVSGSTGNSTGPHVHFELRIPSKRRKEYPQGAVDPSGYFVAEGNLTPGPFPEREGGKMRVTADALNVRLAPNFGLVIGQLVEGTVIQAERTEGEWVGVMMWVNKRYLEGVA